jgi:hypothetical protein
VRDVRHAERRAERELVAERTAAPAATPATAAPTRTEAPVSERVHDHEHVGTAGARDGAMNDTRVDQPVYPEEPGATNVPVDERMRERR